MDEHWGTYLNICRHYHAIYDTPSIQENPTSKLNTLKNVALFAILSPYDKEQSNTIHMILQVGNNLSVAYKILLIKDTESIIKINAITMFYRKNLSS